MLVSNDQLAYLPDPGTDPRLLPEDLIPNSNRKEILRLKIATRLAMERFLTAEQRKLLYLHYEKRQSKTQIARSEGVYPAAVCKRISKAEEILRAQAEFSLEVYKALYTIEEQD